MILNNMSKICDICGSTNTYIQKRGNNLHPLWYKHKGNLLCSKCNYKLWSTNNPDKVKDYNNKKSPKRVYFVNKRVTLDVNPRRGICESCHKKIGDEYIDWYGKPQILRRTSLHHIEYHPEDPLKDTIELCNSCHYKESWRLGCFDNRAKIPFFRHEQV